MEGQAEPPTPAPPPPLIPAPTPAPSAQATLALLAAIESADEKLLLAAIEDTSSSHRGTDGGSLGAPGRRWWTSELRVAHDLLWKLKRRRATKVQHAAAAKERATALGEHLSVLATCSGAEVALGTDRAGRRYWHFAAMDDGRLWVEEPAGAPSGW